MIRVLELLARAPVVSWDDDLAVWDKNEMAFNNSGLEYSHRFLGVGDGSNLVSQATLDRMKMRTRVYSPQLPKVIKVSRWRHPGDQYGYISKGAKTIVIWINPCIWYHTTGMSIPDE